MFQRNARWWHSVVYTIVLISYNLKSTTAKEPEKPKEPEPPQDPKDCKIVAGRDTTIEFQKEKDKGIGLIIAGGSDTPMVIVYLFLDARNSFQHVSALIILFRL